MLRQRERFERIDVPTPSHLRNLVSLGVIVVAAVMCFVVGSLCWRKANQMNWLNNKYLYDALYDQYDVSDPTGGREWSEDNFSNCLVLTVDDIHADEPQLQAAQILVRNTTQNTAVICNLPLNTKLTVGESTTYLPALFANSGSWATLSPLTYAANVHVSHVIVASPRIWEQLASFEGPILRALLSSQTNDFYTISSDFSSGELVKFAEALQAIGFENIAQVDAPFNTENLEDGTEVAVIDRQETPIAVGTFVYPSEG